MMANTTITIDVQKVREAGTKIKDEGNKMYNALQDIKDIVNNTKKCLQSDGGDAARSNFNTSAEKFDDFQKFINDYGQFLESYEAAHKELDNKVAEIANSIPKL